ncbi:flavodoxin-dependent (E)-4-hydroxy-3-methylbut-2-enyl-diphosphate synthase [Candidatus Blochmannia ocreatus (nom. nud.)]|uniref:4-hydroxy-3-methylbut-2-en-1-yl diphosphate synthase (flavodoxin) n=1 Tax=Candidatus Blochmannia ocreatus (nom. nud.) TaxID=251538 RepID=A0ABY4SU61_9ENTR|nr:flavodoxin-dependent (E)-4-hydroxy-3-methylbut-2-enyl-diphosphate synthase [Candidatus Blochmannia ocreatus]URJ25013.1 flavodoxin-dependent (E)-4-hydroxy-3-methylbut-2-enyl-diphosphate synthase [Candidatus Blochmannia ocreatus]
MKNLSNIIRRKSTRIYVGNVPIGDNAPISIQSMVNTRTTDIAATIQQIQSLKKAGVDIIRISIPTIDAAETFKIIKQKITDVPLVADIHFDYRIALKAAEYGADCLRINPGNIGNIERIKSVVHCAQDKNISIRIGVNSGSLEHDLQKKYNGKITANILLESAMKHVNILEKLNFHQFKVSIKSSDALITIQAYRELAKKIDQPLHIGLTESGTFRNGTVKSAITLGFLLNEGIGDTMRISLAADPVEEVKVAFDILRTLNLRQQGVNIIACPGCARQEFDVIKVANSLEEKISDITTPMNVSVIGCVVNGPGEAIKSTIGVAGAKKKSGIYEDGIRQKTRCDNDRIVEELERRIRKKSKF